MVSNISVYQGDNFEPINDHFVWIRTQVLMLNEIRLSFRTYSMSDQFVAKMVELYQLSSNLVEVVSFRFLISLNQLIIVTFVVVDELNTENINSSPDVRDKSSLLLITIAIQLVIAFNVIFWISSNERASYVCQYFIQMMSTVIIYD